MPAGVQTLAGIPNNTLNPMRRTFFADPGQPESTGRYPAGRAYVPDSLRQQLSMLLSEAGIVEADFMAAYRRRAPGIVGRALRVPDLSDEAAGGAIRNMDVLTGLMEGVK